MTATSRTALFRFTFDKAGTGYLSINANSDEGLGRISIDNNSNIVTGSNPAHRIYQGLGEYAGFDGHFIVEIKDKEITEAKTFDNGAAYLKFNVQEGETVMVRVATSFTSIEGKA